MTDTLVLPKILLRDIESETTGAGICLGSIILLPTGAESYCLTLENNSLSVFSKYPGREQQIKVRNDKFSDPHDYKLRVQPHLFKNTYHLMPANCFNQCTCCASPIGNHFVLCNCNECQITRNRYSSSSMSTKYLMYSQLLCINDSHQAAGYQGLNNVYGDGKICFGDDKSYPRTPRQAYTTFWSAYFTSELGLTAGKISYHRSCNTKSHSNKPCFGLKHASRICKRKLTYLCSCPFREFNIHECGGKSSVCHCSCCKNQCNCICQCECCRNICSCHCSCSTDILFDYMQNFTPNFWGGTSYAGNKFVSGVEAIFITQNSHVLSHVPAEFKKPSHLGINYFAGFASQDKKGNWLVDVSGKIEDVFCFTSNQVNLFK